MARHTFNPSGHTLTHTLIPLVHALSLTPREEYKKGSRALSDKQSRSEIPGGSKLELAAKDGTKQRKERAGRTRRKISGLRSQATRTELPIIPFIQAPNPSAQQRDLSGPAQLRFSQPARSRLKRSPGVHLLPFSGSEDGYTVREESGVERNHQAVPK